MVIVSWIPLFVAVISALIYVLTKHPDAKQLAGWSFLASMIALMIWLSGHTIRVG